MPQTINFYRVRGEQYGLLSNFAPRPVTIDGKVWPTTEHYFQAQKFVGTPYEERIREVLSPMTAARMGRDRTCGYPIRDDWDKIDPLTGLPVKEGIMEKALWAKFNQHEDCKQLLLSTDDAILVEHTVNDDYWGDGGDGSGKNRLGFWLMETRKHLKARERKPVVDDEPAVSDGGYFDYKAGNRGPSFD